MKVKRLHLQNYGRFEDLKIDFAPTAEKTGNVTVIVGNNGAGKSQILQALATSLSWFVAKVNKEIKAKDIEPSIIHKGKNTSSIKVIANFNPSDEEDIVSSIVVPNKDVEWSIKHSGQLLPNALVNNLSLAILDDIVEKQIKKANFYYKKNNFFNSIGLPLITYYSVNRGVVDKNSLNELLGNSHPIDGYLSALENSQVDFDKFILWYRHMEDIENERLISRREYKDFMDKSEYTHNEINSLNRQIVDIKRKLLNVNKKHERDDFNDAIHSLEVKLSEQFKDYYNQAQNAGVLTRALEVNKDNKLSSTTRALEYFTNFKNIRIRRTNNTTMIVEKDGEELDINQLSQGEKSLLALVGDIARRLALLNPSLDKPLEGEGVVMIDEVDLHLHPKWQHDLIDKLVATFPNVQFILTTHSPHVISDRNDILLYSLDDGELIEEPNVYGEDVNTVLTKIFDVDIRDSEVEEQFTIIRRAISKHDYLTAENCITELADKLPSDHLELLKCRLLLAQSKLANNNKDESSHAED